MSTIAITFALLYIGEQIDLYRRGIRDAGFSAYLFLSAAVFAAVSRLFHLGGCFS